MIIDIPTPSARAEDLLLGQYQTSPQLKKYLYAYIKEIDILQTQTKALLTERYLDRAIGGQLDVIGRLVGANRTLYGVQSGGYYGFYDAPTALGMGDETQPGLPAGIFKGGDDISVRDIRLTDSQFRRWIEARILKNSTNGSVNDTIRFFRLLLDHDDWVVNVTSPEPAVMRVDLPEALTITEISMVAALAEHIAPAGVEMRVYDTVAQIITSPIKETIYDD